MLGLVTHGEEEMVGETLRQYLEKIREHMVLLVLLIKPMTLISRKRV